MASFSCQSLSISLLCSYSFILLFWAFICSRRSSSANFYMSFFLNSSSMRCSSASLSSFNLRWYSCACRSSCFILSLFSKSYSSLILACSSNSCWYSSFLRFSTYSFSALLLSSSSFNLWKISSLAASTSAFFYLISCSLDSYCCWKRLSISFSYSSSSFWRFCISLFS